MKKLGEITDRDGMAANRIRVLLRAIEDSHLRMATNRDVDYRVEQTKRVAGWLEEATTLLEEHPAARFLIEVPS